MNVGIVGTESSHVDHVVRYFNAEHRAGDARVVAVAEATRDVGVSTVVDRADDLLGMVDAVIVADRDGRQHARQAIPFLRAGVPVFVDKPLAASVADAEAIVGAAQQSDTPVTSFSALRWHPRLRELTGQPTAVVTTGPVDPASSYAGVFFYGIHPVELALILAPGPVSDVHVRRVSGAIVATATVGRVAVCVQMVEKVVPFHVLLTTGTSVTAVELPLGPDYLHPGLDAFLDMVRTGKPPVSYEDLLRPVSFLAAVDTAL
ncbi:Gfo/Idh/MocA family protein [Fodinicola acaciae]|uniref:Gfo/Idh/MocA family protein n=1 Tax=Fodinicola acaciae TaxID=2681555 RepID=UPI0013D36400|nr:Gfo/Idh/MocA family oxidoreductase [Fodinicola acaciae]